MPEPTRFGGTEPEPWRAPAGDAPPPYFTTPAPGGPPPPPPAPAPPAAPAAPANPYAPVPAPGINQFGVQQFGAPQYGAPQYGAAQYPPPPGYPPAYPGVGVPYGGPAQAIRGSKGLGIAMLVLGAVLVLLFLLRALTAPGSVHKLDRFAAAGYDTRGVPTAHDQVGLLGLVVFPLFIVGALWLYRAQANARALAPQGVRRAQAWAWFGWVTPIAGWFVPKQIVDDAWRVTAPPAAGPGSASRVRATGLWWGLWVAFNVLSGATGHFWFSVSTKDPTGCLCQPYTGHRGISPGWDLVVAVLAVAAYAAWVPIALGLSNAQEELVTRLRGGGPVTY